MGLVKPARGWRITDGAWDETLRGIEGLWLFNEGSGTIVADASGHGRHGTAAGGMVWEATPTGWGATLDGTNDYVETTVPPGVFAADYTIAVRLRLSNYAAARGVFQVANAPLSQFGAQAIIHTTDAWMLRTYSTAGTMYSVTLNGLDTLWHTLVLSQRGTAVHGYRDGVSGTPATFSGTRYTLSGVVRMGMRLVSGTWQHPMVGQYGYAAIWSRALSAQEVRRLHEQPPWMVG